MLTSSRNELRRQEMGPNNDSISQQKDAVVFDNSSPLDRSSPSSGYLSLTPYLNYDLANDHSSLHENLLLQLSEKVSHLMRPSLSEKRKKRTFLSYAFFAVSVIVSCYAFIS